tara:strand:- start:418 stop:537 length:120 start_codon:yes stop_codon:yes gene_type:complete
MVAFSCHPWQQALKNNLEMIDLNPTDPSTIQFPFVILVA